MTPCDEPTHSHPILVTDASFDLKSSAEYELRFGTIKKATDVNGQVETFSYDKFGRLCTVAGPDDQGMGAVPSIAMSYGIKSDSCPNASAAGNAFPAYAVTRHKDVQHPGDPIDTVTFIDGLARVIQTKKDLDRDPAGNGVVTTGMSVSGQVQFDGRGRVSGQAQPAFSTPLAPMLFS